MSAVIHQFHALPREPKSSVEPVDATESMDLPEHTALAIHNCLQSLLVDAEGQGLTVSAAALRLAIEVVAADLRPRR